MSSLSAPRSATQIHPSLVCAEEEVRRRPLEGLGSKAGSGFETEPDRSSSCSLPELGDPGKDVREAGCSQDQQGGIRQARPSRIDPENRRRLPSVL